MENTITSSRLFLRLQYSYLNSYLKKMSYNIFNIFMLFCDFKPLSDEKEKTYTNESIKMLTQNLFY